MAISSTTIRWAYTGTGSNTVFAYSGRITDDDQLTVIETDTSTPAVDTTLTKTTHYTVSDVGTSGGNVTLVTALTLNYTLTIVIEYDVTQSTDIRNQGSYFAETHEERFDYQTRIDQYQQDQLDRSPHFPRSVNPTAFDNELPQDAIGTDSAVPMFDTDGTGWAASSTWPTGATIASAEAFANAAAAASGTLSPVGINNLGTAAAVASSALTVSLKQADGSTDPASGTGAVTIYFRDSTITDGAVNARSATTATSIVVPSGATLGHDSGKNEQIHIYAIDNAGAIELAVSSSNLFTEFERYTTTAIDATADDASTLYSTTARTSVPIRLIGRLKSSQTVAGTWDSAISTVHSGYIFRPESTKNRTAAFVPKHKATYKADTSGGAFNCNLPVPRSGYFFDLIDNTNSFTANNLTLVRNGSEKIDNLAASKILNVAGSRARVHCDGTNWFTYGNTTNETSYTTFNGPTTGSLEVTQTNYGTFPISGGTLVSSGAAIVLATDVWTFPYVGTYHITVDFGHVNNSTGIEAVKVRLRNTTDSTTADIAIGDYSGTGSDYPGMNFSLTNVVTDVSKDYELQFVTSTGGATVMSSSAHGSDNSRLWKVTCWKV